MKKLISTFLFGILLQSSFAQDKAELPACLIVNAGFNLAALPKTDYYWASEANPGFSGGAIVRTDGDFYFMGGIQYVIANPTLQNKAESNAELVTLQLLQFPLMAGLQITKSDDSKRTMHAQIGGSFSSLLSVSENNLGIEKENLNKDGFTLRFGFGADLYNFTADLTYNMLVSHLYDEAGYSNKAKLMSWEITIGYKIELNKHKYD